MSDSTNSKRPIIGLVGKKGSGKSTVANILAETEDYVEIAFADPLKQICQTLFLLSHEELHDTKMKEQIVERVNTTPRRILQQVGTNLMRDRLREVLPELPLTDQLPSIWVWNAQQRILDLRKRHCEIVVSDVRFPDEASMIRRLGGILIRIRRDANTFSSDLHPSEVEMENIDVNFEIDNDGSLEELKQKITSLTKDQ